jgi:hypothetical protein
MRFSAAVMERAKECLNVPVNNLKNKKKQKTNQTGSIYEWNNTAGNIAENCKRTAN